MGRFMVLTGLSLALFLPTAVVPAAASDSLTVGQSIKDNETLVSGELGTFVLGFFTGRRNNRYLGIWYTRIPGPTVVWVANRQRPLLGSTGSLTLFPNGSLVLSDANGTTYWSTGPSMPALNSPVARLLDDGNLVVLNGSGNSYLWQSFAHPANTMIPGMNLGQNRRAGNRLYLASWRSADDPTPGEYSAAIDTLGVPQLVVMNGSTTLWRGGPFLKLVLGGQEDMRGQLNPGRAGPYRALLKYHGPGQII